MIVRVAGIPAALSHVDPAPQPKRLLRQAALDHHLARLGKKFFPAFDGECVSARQKLDAKRMRRKRRVHFDGVCVEAAAPLVTNGRSAHGCTFGKMPGPIRAANIESGWKRFACRVIDNLSFHEHLVPSGFPLLDDGQWVRRGFLRIDVSREVAKRDHFESVRLEIAHELLETLWPRVDPRMFAIRHAVKLQHRDAPGSCLVGRTFEIIQGPIRSSVARGWNQQRMIRTRFISEPASPVVGMLRRAAAPREPDTQSFENRQRVRHDGIARIAKTDWPRNAMLRAARIDRFDLFPQLSQRSLRNTEVIPRVIADLKAVPVQFRNLFPRHVILLVRAKRKSFRDEERRAESVPLQQRPHDRVMRDHRVIEGEHDELVRHRLQRPRSGRPHMQKDDAQQQTRPAVHGGNCRQPRQGNARAQRGVEGVSGTGTATGARPGVIVGAHARGSAVAGIGWTGGCLDHVAVSIAVQCSRKRIAADRALANLPKQEVQMLNANANTRPLPPCLYFHSPSLSTSLSSKGGQFRAGNETIECF